MNKVILCRGIQGSGKSTWAKNWVKEDPIHRVRWNNDDVRNMFGEYWVVEREKTHVLDLMKETFIKRMMSCGYNIVIDDMNLNLKTVDSIKEIVENQNKFLEIPYIVEFKDFFISVEECIRRDALRPNPIGEKVIKQTWKKYRDYILGIENNKLKDNLEKQNIKLKHAIIVDLDATVCLNISGRPFYGPGCAEKIHLDYPVQPVIDIVNNYKGDVLYVTGREDTPEIRDASWKWIENNIGVGPYDRMLMRPQGDFSSGEICKLNIYNSEIKDKYYIDFILEDSIKVVNMYRSLGLTVLQPNEGKF